MNKRFKNIIESIQALISVLTMLFIPLVTGIILALDYPLGVKIFFGVILAIEVATLWLMFEKVIDA